MTAKPALRSTRRSGYRLNLSPEQRKARGDKVAAYHGSLEERFWRKVAVADGDACWEWKGARELQGYGILRLRTGKSLKAHRLAWQIATGQPPPTGLCVCHHCDNRRCVNPAHLFLGTSGDNTRDAWKKGRIPKPVAPRGEAHPLAKLTTAQVLEIRAARDAGVPCHKPARKYRVCKMVIHRIGKRTTRAHG